MEDMEEKILGVLRDPQQMEQIMAIAGNLGLTQEEGDAPPVTELLQKFGAPDHRQEALMHALAPYLKPQRRKKLERALRLAKLSHLAGFALQHETGDLNV